MYCLHQHHIKSLDDWELRKYGIVHTETMLGHEYGYCIHASAELVSIQTEAVLHSIGFWYRFERPAHAIIEITFIHGDKFINVLLEGFQEITKKGSIACHQFCGRSMDVSTAYLKRRSAFYQLLQRTQNIEFAMTYQDAINGPIKQTNEFYVRHEYVRSDIMDDGIKLNHDCLWYAVSIYSKLTGISKQESLTNQNITKPIIGFKIKCFGVGT